ncbi:MAG: hypothetical protein ACKOCT_15985, partial [Alphaproteobacteria bacterium]
WQNYERDRKTYGLIGVDDAAENMSAREVLLRGLDRLFRRLDERGIRVWVLEHRIAIQANCRSGSITRLL